MRLIDADAFIEYLGLDAEDAREINLGEVVSLEDFDRQPTAYDVNKVVEYLKSEEARWEESGKEYKDKHELGIAEGYRRAAKDVESGKIE